MYICPTCHRGYKNKEVLTSHFLSCWREHNPGHKSKPAPCKGNTTERQMSEDVFKFFESFRKD